MGRARVRGRLHALALSGAALPLDAAHPAAGRAPAGVLCGNGGGAGGARGRLGQRVALRAGACVHGAGVRGAGARGVRVPAAAHGGGGRGVGGGGRGVIFVRDCH